MEEKQPRKDPDDYDPYVERKLPKGTNNLESMMHIIKGILGTGILALPEAFKNAGLFLGFLATVGNGILCTYAVHVLVHSFYVLCKRNRIPVLTYTDAMEIGCKQGPPWSQKRSKTISRLADIFLILYQAGVCCVYTIFVVLNLKSVGDVYMKKDLSVHVYLLIMIVPLLLINSFRNLKILAPFSLAANAITFVTIAAVFYYIFETPLPNIRKLPIFQLNRFALAYGTTCFSTTSIAVVIAVENNMKTPKYFGGWFGIYNRSIAILLSLNTALGFLGFWKYGEETKPSIALNLPPDDIVTQLVNLLFAFAIYTSHGLNGYVPIQMVWENYLTTVLEESKYKVAWEYLLRVFLVALSVVLAATIPMLGLFMSVFGAIELSFLLFIFPAILDICTRYPNNYGRFQIYKARDYFFIVYGVIGLVTGVSVGVYEMAIELNRMTCVTFIISRNWLTFKPPFLRESSIKEVLIGITSVGDTTVPRTFISDKPSKTDGGCRIRDRDKPICPYSVGEVVSSQSGMLSYDLLHQNSTSESFRMWGSAGLAASSSKLDTQTGAVNF
ncbi:hypothetical protein Trydic_g16554 [Trypoxylus dichotomus]